jgi:cation:H+ antiporter
LVVLWDKQVTLGESILMLATYGIYLLYTVLHKEPISLDDEDEDNIQIEENTKIIEDKSVRPKLVYKDFLLLVIGILGLVFGAKYLVDSLIELSKFLNISTGLIAITAVAVGTSLPELLVSIKAALQKKSEVALGNIFGSNLFNGLVVVGFSGLFRPLTVDNQTFLIGLPIMALATILFIFSGISRRIHIWEGAFYLSLYILFIAKLFNFF